jgi:hypothetical protein
VTETPQQTSDSSLTPPPSDIQTILDPIKVDKKVKAKAWDAFHSAKSPEEFKHQFDSIDLPKESKAALWNAKYKPKQHLPEAKGFFETHEKTREGLLGMFGGLGIPETKTPVRDLGKGLIKTFGPPETKDEKAFMAIGLPVAVYRMAKGMVQQAFGLSEEVLSSVDWNAPNIRFKKLSNPSPAKLKRLCDLRGF